MWEAYDFTLSGAGYYSFEPRNLFYYVNSTSTAVPIYARTIIHEAHISGRLAVTRENPAPTAREYVQFVGCTVPQQLRLQDAFAQADYIVKETSTFVCHQNYFRDQTVIPEQLFANFGGQRPLHHLVWCLFLVPLFPRRKPLQKNQQCIFCLIYLRLYLQ